MGVIIPQVLTEDRASGAQIVDGSLRFDSGKSHYLSRTPGSGGNRRTWTWSGWVKRSLPTQSLPTLFGTFDANGLSNGHILYFDNDTIKLGYAPSGAYTIEAVTTAVFRDYSAWYHIVAAFDTTQAVAADRYKLYVNGVQQTVTNNTWAQNTDYLINNTITHGIGRAGAYNGSVYFSGYLANIHFIDGQALDASYFGYTDPLTNTWRPKKFSTPASALYQSFTTLNWASGTQESNWALSNSNKTATYSGSSTYSDVFTAALNSSTTYAFRLNTTVSDTNGGWFFTDDTAIGGTHPDERGSNSLGLRSGESSLGAHGTYATANSVTAGQNAISGFDNVTPSNGSTIHMVINMTARKVWVKSSNASTWIGGGDPNNSSSTASFLLPSGTVYFAFVAYTSATITMDTLDAFGTNGFYLPLDGNTPIGQDQSGRGNNWTPVNFGGSNTIEKATGALPILNTDGGGKVARVGVRTDSNASSLVLALPLVGIKSDFSNAINSGTSNKAITANGNAAGISTQSNFYGGSFAFDGTGDTLSVPSSSDFQIWSGAFTVECWFYLSSLVDNRGIFGVGNRASTTTRCFLITRSTGNLQFDWDGWSADGSLSVSAGLSAGRWYHCAVVSTGSTVSIYVNGVSLGSASIGSSSEANAPLSIGALGSSSNPATNDGINGYIQDFRIYKGVAKYTQNFIPASTDPDILPDTPSGVAYSSNVALVPSTDGGVAFDNDGDYLSLSQSDDFSFGTGAFTCEMFCYFNSLASDDCILEFRGNGTAGQGWVLFVNGSAMQIYDNAILTASTTTLTTKKWYHLAISRTSGGTLYYFVDGVAAGTASWTTSTANTNGLRIGTRQDTTNSFDGFISNLHIVKGTALYTANFTPPTAPITSVANTKLLCCKSQTSATAFDVSPGTITANGDAKATNFNPFTVNINTQRGQESGYATLDPLSKQANCTLSNGNLNWASTSTSSIIAQTNIGMISGKWYCEFTATSSDNMFGLQRQAGTITTLYVGGNADSWGYYGGNGNKYNNNTNSSYGSTYTTGDVIGVSFDADAGTLIFYKNGISQGTAYTGLTNGPYTFAIGNGGASSGTPNASANFGQKPFKFPPPAGFQPLALANTPRPTIVRPDQYVGVTTYTGTGASLSLTTGFKPDLVWTKNRGASQDHALYDSVRGVGKVLSSNTTNLETTTAQSLTSFDTYGFTVGTAATSNTSTNTYAAWAWKAGGNSNTYNINDVGYATTTAAGLTAGTITPTGASVNTKSGFSIITYTGTGTSPVSISHGLNLAPTFLIFKDRDSAVNWQVWTTAISSGGTMLEGLNTTAAGTTPWTYISTTSSLIQFNSGNSAQTTNGKKFICYAWHDVPGFSRFSSYTGNGSTDGPVIITGFRPAFVMMKMSSSTSHWWISDNKRTGSYNAVDGLLFPNLSSMESTFTTMDFLSNGFKLRTASSDINTSSATYIYCAFAETPSFNLYGGQANAR